jgi:hypothetical protein
MVVDALMSGLGRQHLHPVPFHLLLILPAPLLHHVVLCRVQTGSRRLSLESFHPSKEVFIHF